MHCLLGCGNVLLSVINVDVDKWISIFVPATIERISSKFEVGLTFFETHMFLCYINLTKFKSLMRPILAEWLEHNDKDYNEDCVSKQINETDLQS